MPRQWTLGLVVVGWRWNWALWFFSLQNASKVKPRRVTPTPTRDTDHRPLAARTLTALSSTHNACTPGLAGLGPRTSPTGTRSTHLPVWLSSTRGDDVWSISRPSTCPQYPSRGPVPARHVPHRRRPSPPPRSSMAPAPAPAFSLPPAPRPSTARRQTRDRLETGNESEPHPYARRPRPTMSSMIPSSSRYACNPPSCTQELP